MEPFNFITVRLGKDSIPDIQEICSSEVGVLRNPFIIKVKCTQIPDNYGVNDYAFLWLGSDNNKGMPTQWKQGFKAVGHVENVTKGKSYNDTSETTIRIIYIFREAINRMDILRCAPIAYYWCSSMPLIGLDDHANQTIRNMSGSSFSDIRAFFSAIEAVTNHFKIDILQIEPRFEQFFDFILPNPQSHPTAKNLDEISSIKRRSKGANPLQQIFYGAPGTGKSNTIKCEVDNKGLPCVRTTFHPDSDYSTFVGAYKPTSIEVPVVTMIGTKAVSVENPNGSIRTEKKIVYEFVPQAFLKAYTGAWKNQDEPFFLIIEEINRGNCAQIFGDLFQLLDRNDETGRSDYPISPDEDIQIFLLSDKKYGFAALKDEQKIAIPEAVQTGELMILPSNLHIWATMNTSDQSLFPIDSAFKRRWDWKYIPISDGKKGWRIKANGKHYDWWQFLQKINDQIGSTTNSEDKKLGYYFCKAKNGIIDAETFVGKVMFYVWNDVYKDFAEEAGDLFKDIDGSLLSFSKFYTIGKDGNTEVVEEKIEIFLQNLGVPILDYLYTEDDSPLLDENGDELDENSNEVAVIGKRNFDYTKYSINGKGVYPKGRVAKEAISLFVSMHPDMTAEEIVKVWLDLNIKISNMVETSQMFESRTASSADPGLHSRYKTVTMPNGEILYVSNQYNVERINDFISKVNSQDWDIHIESIEE
jgi:hypothetical protein